MRRIPFVLMLVGAALVAPAESQQPAPPPADPEDVASVDAILAALYDVISGPAGQERNWDRFRSLFHPDAKLIPVFRAQNPPGAATRARYMSVEGYVASSGPMLTERGFFEREIGRVEERFGGIVHAFSTYDSRWTADGDVFQRGINSIQLMTDGSRWWVINVMWQGVGPDVEIPGRYVGGR